MFIANCSCRGLTDTVAGQVPVWNARRPTGVFRMAA
jgi:hypothetical protein